VSYVVCCCVEMKYMTQACDQLMVRLVMSYLLLLCTPQLLFFSEVALRLMVDGGVRDCKSHILCQILPAMVT